MNSRIFRTQLSLLPIVFAIELTLCAAVAYFISGREFEIWHALIMLAILYCARIAIAIVNTINATALYYITKSDRVNMVVSMLYQAKVPATDELRFCDDTLAEFARIAAKSDTPAETRQFLLLTIAEVSVMRSSGKYLAMMQSLAVIDKGVQKYVAENAAKQL